MTALAHRLPFSLDPLIEGARRRMRRRRALGAVLLILVAAVGAVAVTASRSPGGPHAAGPSSGRQVRPSDTSRPRVDVPVDSTERLWRIWVLSQSFGITVGPRVDVQSLRRRVESAVLASGASVVRLKVWQGRFERPPVELVVTARHPARYLKHRLEAVLQTFDHGYLYVQVADRHGSRILEWTTRSRTGSLYVKRALFDCSPVLHGGLVRYPACPAG
ncbi:MAG TPA: hypothetical protein VFV91_01505 [Gaiellaceae bacterium]|nr:hypothetical protein [Gaiellaceae bacterium]